MKRFFYYFVSVIIIGVLFFWGMKLEEYFQHIANATFNLIPFVLFTTIFPIILGLLLRLPQLILQLKENKRVTYDWVKFTAIAIPTLYILISYILSYLGFVRPTYFMMIGGHALITISGIVFGYTILASLKSTQTH